MIQKTFKNASFKQKKYLASGSIHLNYLLFIICCIVFVACNSPYISKKRGYYKIDLPQRSYQIFDQPEFPYSFEYPVYANVIEDTTYHDNIYSRNIDFPQFNARIFLSYKKIGDHSTYKIKQLNGQYKDSLGINEFDKLVADAFTLTNKNDVVSSSINDSLIHTANGISGIFFKVGGNAATSKQFLLTDTTKNFIRGALYFNLTPNVDSLRPIQDFLQVDIEHIINTFRWKNKS